MRLRGLVGVVFSDLAGAVAMEWVASEAVVGERGGLPGL